MSSNCLNVSNIIQQSYQISRNKSVKNIINAKNDLIFKEICYLCTSKFIIKIIITVMATQEDVFKKLVSHCKEYGFVFPSSEIYDGLGAV